MSRRKRSGSSAESVPTAVLAHSCSHRTRLSFLDRKGDKAFFETLCDAAVKLPGVKEAEGRVLTGSLILKHDDGSKEILEAARCAGVFDTHQEDEAIAPEAELEIWKTWLDEALKHLGGPNASANTSAALAFFIMALTQAARGQTMPPAATSLWYAITLLLAARGQGRQGGAADPFSGNVDGAGGRSPRR